MPLDVDKTLLVGGAAVVVGAALLARQATQSRREVGDDPCGPDPSLLPEGRSVVVPTADGAELAATVAGPDDAPTVVLSHCWTGSRAVWATVGRKLVADGFRVVMYDQRGHGESTLGDEPVSIDGLGHDLAAVLAATDTDRAILAGHSMGGMTIQSYAAVAPEDFASRTEGVVLAATAARTIGRAVPAGFVDALLGEGRMEWSRRGRVGQRVARGSLGRVVHPAHLQLTADSFAATPGVARSGFLAAMAAMDLRATSATIAAPTTVLVGTRDRLTPPPRARALARAIQGAELIVLPGTGHMLPLEAPDDVVRAVHGVARRAGVRQAVETAASVS